MNLNLGLLHTNATYSTGFENNHIVTETTSASSKFHNNSKLKGSSFKKRADNSFELLYGDLI